MPDLKEKIEYQKNKFLEALKKATAKGIRIDDATFKFNCKVEVIKNILIEKQLATKDELDLEYFRVAENSVKDIIEAVDKQRSEKKLEIIRG